MTKKPTTEQKRLITSAQSTGRIGKSTLMGILHSYLKKSGINHLLIDADGEHMTLTQEYSSAINLPYNGDKDSLAEILSGIEDSELTLIDFPAQVTKPLLRSFDEMATMRFLKEKGIRPTLFLFASDEPAAMSSAANLISFFGSEADYIKVKIPGKFESSAFDAHPFFAVIEKEITIPVLTNSALSAWRMRMKTDKKFYSLVDFAELEHGTQSAFEIEQWIEKVHNQLNKVKDVLSPALPGEYNEGGEGFKPLKEFF